MLEFNLISRIADDKNFFVDIICSINELKTKHNIIAKIKFIGAVQNEGLYRALIRLSEVLEISELVEFTKRSISYENLTEDIKKGYFINFTVGTFIGYSSIECLKYNLKTIFYNVDPRHSVSENIETISFCSNYKELISTVKEISMNKSSFDQRLEMENRNSLFQFSLTEEDAQLLKTMMVQSL